MRTATRTPLRDYPRDERQALRLTGPEPPERRRRWNSYLTGGPAPEAPLATRFVPALAGPVPGYTDVAWPATLYPAGFRRQVLTHCALTTDPATDPDADEPDALRKALRLNSMSRYRTTVRMYARHTRSPGRAPHLAYEVTRAAYQIGQTDAAVAAFAALGGDRCPHRAVRLNAVSRLIAHYARSGRDLEACEVWVRHATRLLDAPDDDYAEALAVSRVHRAVALFHARRRDPVAVGESLTAALTTHRNVRASSEEGLRRLELDQNERLVLEAALKAFVSSGGRADPLDAARAVLRLTELDPWDPTTRLVTGDAHWMLEDDRRALESYAAAHRMGSLAGALAAHRAAQLLTRTGRPHQARSWWAAAGRLDPAATTVEVPGE